MFYALYLPFYIGCVGSVGIFSGGLGHISPVCVTLLCGVAGRYNFIWRFLLERMAGLYGFSFFSGSVVAGTVRFKW